VCSSDLHIPGHQDDGYYLADLLTDLLSNGKSAILYQYLLKQQQLVQSVSAYTWGLHDPGPIFIDARLAEGVGTESYDRHLQIAIEKLQELTEEDLDRIKGKLASIFVMQKTTLLNKAMGLAMYEAIGDPNLINTIPDRYRSLTLEQVKTGARQYLAPENCSTLYYLPESMQESAQKE